MAMNKLLLLHGALGSTEQFAELQSLLAKKFDVFTFNFSGHGGRSASDSFSIELFVNDTEKYLREKKHDAVDIFGYSMGGYVALALALRSPSLVNRIVTLGTKFNWTKASAEEEVKLLVPSILEQKLPAYTAALEKRHHPEDWKSIMTRTADMMLDMGNGNAMQDEDFRIIQHEVHLLLGSRDNMVTVEETKHVADLMPNATFTLIPDLKHPIESVDKNLLASQIISILR